MSNKIIFIIGGARSGKSSFALAEASRIKGQKAYIATAEALDDEMKERIEKHKKDRGSDWNTYEEPVNISSVLSEIKEKYSAVVLDCLTLWLSNILTRAPRKAPEKLRIGTGSQRGKQDTKKSIQEFIEELEAFKKSSIVNPVKGHARKAPWATSLYGGPNGTLRPQSSIFIVSNEVGLGIVPDNELARSFRDWAGLLNQKVAETADEVYLVTAGIPLKIK
ncbi:MAG TPA: bifunctional adenosylcobinamide kinase/adenosylcobinamide-phosphate guanylyltransferase [Nitrospirae bacterium]|nr:bifunctional adenosylcobalamin biosynthesis protein CobU [bacterium BMS3Bbin08]HDH50096.1 bifunctional adenosylcobinamide kinase/adenosylcobinamide-phosphate guanylyltransferase [Nitrospirota bacterium]HDK82329.1 bifunctional adenosylcobinamide kinase/adenosylcobinamide-phosphate guanylyltransferase [Nitrospirota bacterium]HDO26171.1 bifunctional adenosylcobinamide kinase/adenosylcobinamide-phosphate guanylyltransferase [Nitrospirota bacterium]